MSVHDHSPAIKFLQNHGISFDLYEHDAFHSVSESSAWAAQHPGCHIKNLFLHDKKNNAYYLLFMPGAKRLDFKVLKEHLGVRPSFASSDDVQSILGTTPGHVSPFVLISAPTDVQVLYDTDIHNAEYIFFHPLVNHLTVRLKVTDFATMLNTFDHSVSGISI